MLRVCSVSFASNSWPSADAGHSKRRCWAKFWTAADAENAHSGVGLPACGSLAPLRKVYVVWFRQRTGRLALLRGLYGLFRFWRVGAVRFHSLFQSHTESNRTALTHQNAKSQVKAFHPFKKGERVRYSASTVWDASSDVQGPPLTLFKVRMSRIRKLRIHIGREVRNIAPRLESPAPSPRSGAFRLSITGVGYQRTEIRSSTCASTGSAVASSMTAMA